MFSDLNAGRREPSGVHPCLVTASRPSTACIDACAPGSRIAKLITDFPIAHQRLRQGEHLFRAGAPFPSLYVLNAGFAKPRHVSEDGREQTTGFHLRGDILGLDAVATGTYGSDAIALDLCDVLAIPYEAVIANGQRNPDLVRELHRAFSSEIRSERDLMLSLGSLAAEGRVAAFLLEMSQRFGARGFSPTDLQLRLTRQEIGSLLGLKLETVSRAFSHFAKLGMISVHLRRVVLLRTDRLREVIGHSSGPGERPALSDII